MMTTPKAKTLRRASWGAAVALAAMAYAPAASAHHSVQTEFDVEKVFEFLGEFTRVDWTNPHIWMHFTQIDVVTRQPVLGADGKPVAWAVEATSPAAMRQFGVRDETYFVVGGRYAVTVFPDRTGVPRGHVITIRTPDGKVLHLGDGPDPETTVAGL